MNYVIKTYNGDRPLYFYKLCRKVYQYKVTPAFQEDIADAYVFDTKDRAYRIMSIISGLHPELHLELEELKENTSLRGPDGYVPLKNTVRAMLSNDFRRRLWAEYEQLNTRRHALKKYRAHLDKDKADPAELVVIDEQLKHMHAYMIDILTRCKFAGVDLDEVEKEVNEE